MLSFYKIFGSINIIGNPVGLVQNIAIGVWDFVDKPMTGFIKGPLEGSYGLFRGIGSLVYHSF